MATYGLPFPLLIPPFFLLPNHLPKNHPVVARMFSAPRSSSEDPLAHVFAPPPNESQHDKENRLRAEQEAKRRSDAIDEEINKERAARKNKPVKILLLGESKVPFCFHPRLDY